MEQYLDDKKGENYPLAYFFQADTKNNIINEIKGRDDEGSKIFRRLWYEFPDGNDPTHIYPRFDENKFTTVSLQFALHYFMESSGSLSGLLDNINNNLKKGGLFVGSCLDGTQVFNALQGQRHIEGSHDSNVLWKIEKGYIQDTFPDNNQSLGLPIDVYMSSINRKHREYLVNFKYLKNKLAEHPYYLRPVTKEMASDIGLPSCYDPSTGLVSFRDLANSIISGPSGSNIQADAKELSYIRSALDKMTEAEKEISYLNVGFAFYKAA